jgi:hypothetical protein
MQFIETVAQAWVALGAAGQAVVIGVLAWAVFKLVQWRFPAVQCTANDVKRVLIAIGTGLAAYAATHDLGAAFAAAMSAFGAYDLFDSQAKAKAKAAAACDVDADA